MIEDFSVNYSVFYRGTDGAIISAVEIVKGAGTMITISDLFQFVTNAPRTEVLIISRMFMTCSANHSTMPSSMPKLSLLFCKEKSPSVFFTKGDCSFPFFLLFLPAHRICYFRCVFINGLIRYRKAFSMVELNRSHIFLIYLQGQLFLLTL